MIMKKSDHFEALIRLFKAAPINQKIYLSSKLEIADGECTYKLIISSEYFHGAEALHGSVYFKMLDDAAYFAAASQELDHFLVTKSYTIEFIRPVKAETLIARGRVMEKSASGFIVESQLLNENEKVVGRGKGEFVRSKLRLDSIEDYSIRR